MRNMSILFLLLCSVITISAQKTSISFNGSYRTEIKDSGIGLQLMIPVYKNIYIAPGLSYFFEKDYGLNGSIIKYNSKTKTFNYGIDVHYAFYLKKSDSFISPFLGIEGMSSSGNFSQSIYDLQGRDWTSRDGNINTFNILGNIGIAGRWFVSDGFFVNTQAKYSFVPDDTDSNFFVFTIGIGFTF